MLLWSYFAVVFTDPNSVPPNWRPVSDEERGETDPLTEEEVGGMSADPVNPRIRYCRKCNQPKPPRCHHCSVCEFVYPILLETVLFSNCFRENKSDILLFFFLYIIFMWEVCAENGPSLCMGCQLCRGIELQVFSSFPGMFFLLLNH
ncbi:putative protein S-acyltransferase 14 [Camellia lanceoleosa]|uniref:Uncharacterized protein n=1 Tax=Camellia lanceoleosa TaxID=1840588 RepID=A0ACC0H1U5_9ERIC|nr:putative protein S-acyltransferase 14 [Camellia lanceoleosa]